MGREKGIDRDNHSVGIIFGNISTKQFKFAITDSEVKRTGYVQVWHERNAWVLGQVTELTLDSKLSYSRMVYHQHLDSHSVLIFH